jgi:hypothetical protein
LVPEACAPFATHRAGQCDRDRHNLIAYDVLFRPGFAGYLIEAFTDVALTFLLYALLRPVHANLAFLAALFRLMATATFAFGELFSFAPSLILGGDGYLKTFWPEQLDSLALLSLNMWRPWPVYAVLWRCLHSLWIFDRAIGLPPTAPGGAGTNAAHDRICEDVEKSCEVCAGLVGPAP